MCTHSFEFEERSAANEIDFYRAASRLNEKARQILESRVALAQQEEGSVVCILLDIDHFWALVHSRRPAIGQSLLLQSEEFLRRVAHPGQAVSYGRDEFLIVVEDIGPEDALILAEKIRGQLAEMLAKWSLDGSAADPSRIGCSAGVALYPDHAADAGELLRAAEEGVYRAKQQGRGRTRLSTRENMILKSNYYSTVQLERLKLLAERLERTEASLLREALDTLLREHDV